MKFEVLIGQHWLIDIDLLLTSESLILSDITGAVLTDLLKHLIVFITIYLQPNVMYTNLKKRSLEFIHSYLTKRKQITKADSAFSSWEMLHSGVPQGLILGPLLFNIYISDMFLQTPENIDFARYADDNTPYTYSSKIEHVNHFRKTLFLVFCKSLGRKCWKMLSSRKF